MKTFAHRVKVLASVALVGLGGLAAQLRSEPQVTPGRVGHENGPVAAVASHTPASLTEVVREVCGACHNDTLMTGGLVLDHFDVTKAPQVAEVAEKMIVKLRAGMMPPPGMPRPRDDTLDVLAETLESTLDAAAETNPGFRSFQRLNRAEYRASIRDLLGIEIDTEYLPLDTRSANFDNIADTQILSPAVMEAYLRVAADVARLAVGDARVSPASATYTNPGYRTQWDRVEGAPRGTRGGIAVVHNFVSDGKYIFKMAFEHTTTGGFYGDTARDEQIEISIDGSRVAVLEVDRWMHVSDPNGVNMETDPIFVRSGPHRVAAAFLRRFEGPVEDLMSAHDWSLVDRQIGVGGYGITALPHLKDLVIQGPYNPTGVSETPTRRRIFTCRPTSPAEEQPCARKILGALGSRAFRRPVTDADLDALMSFYEAGAKTSGFEMGIRIALQAILASPDFVFRVEEVPVGVRPGQRYRIRDLDLASRLSFFVWGSPPDDELVSLADQERLRDPDILTAQTRRLLGDSRSEALATRFASLWLRLEDLEKVHPDRLLYPDYHQQLAEAMRRETELFFDYLVRQDRSFFDLFTADYTFVNARLARHYGFPQSIPGEQFIRVRYPDEGRRGLLGHGSVLTLTSHANRTSPVLRGKWVMEVLLGTPPPPPPPGVPDFEETDETRDGRLLTTRERMEQHRSNPACRSCHRYIDPIGLALDGFDVTGRWRIRENSMPLDTRGELYDGTAVASPAELVQALLQRPLPLLRTFTENLMAYALGRRVEYYDQPAIRRIVRQAAANEYRMSSFVLGVVHSDAFQMKRLLDGTGPDTKADRQR